MIEPKYARRGHVAAARSQLQGVENEKWKGKMLLVTKGRLTRCVGQRRAEGRSGRFRGAFCKLSANLMRVASGRNMRG